jgi:hypothetical protein
MSIIDKQRVAAVATLEAIGYTFSLAEDWSAPNAGDGAVGSAEGDAMHTLLVHRADALEGCTEGSAEEAELKSIAGALEAYETKRWPNGKETSGKS